MLYISDKDLAPLYVPWPDTINVIGQAVSLIGNGDYHQPVKPYVRFGSSTNRIIAMPAYIGGNIELAGIKWIASFPHNLAAGIPRAHSVTVLNNAETGVPVCIINTALVSGVRTASLSGYIIKEFISARSTMPDHLTVGITGFGPIGQLHLMMAVAILGGKIGRVCLYDTKQVDLDKVPPSVKDKVKICNSWEEAYQDADIFITATVSGKGYIGKTPKPGALLLNVSLRDFTTDTFAYVNRIVVDSWEEVCRENTDIENMHKEKGLRKEDTWSLADFKNKHPFTRLGDDEVVMFNPMGMAVFDIAIGGFYYQYALQKGIGISLQ